VLEDGCAVTVIMDVENDSLTLRVQDFGQHMLDLIEVDGKDLRSGPIEQRNVRLYTRNGYNFASRFPQIVEAVSKLKVRSCFIDGEAIVVDECGLSAFDLLRSWRHDHAAILCAFDLIEVDGKDLRSGPIEGRKHVLAEILHPERKAIVFNVHYDCDGATIFKHACALGWRGLCQSDLARPTAPGDRRIGSRLKIQKRRRSNVTRKRIGAANLPARCFPPPWSVEEQPTSPRSVPTISRWHPLLPGCWLYYVLAALSGGTYSAERPSHQHD
jgi:bifunctional non-homologous end joining protein LigD